MRVSRTNLLLCFGLIALAAAVYHQILQADFFVLDDSLYVIENANLRLGLSWEGIRWALTTNRGGFWIPLTWLSFLADAQVYGINPGGFHLTNLLFHIANTVLLFVVLHKMTGSMYKSAFVAAMFGIHPMHVESVAWVTERKDVLFGFFWMLSLWAYTRYVNAPGWKPYLLVSSFFTLGLMAKPMIVTLPLVLLLLDYWPLQRIKAEDLRAHDKKALRLVGEKIPLLAIALGFSAATFFLQNKAGAVAPLETVPLVLRMANALVSYATYAIKTFWPFDIAVYYPMPEILPPWWMWGGAAFMLAAVTILAGIHWKSHKYFLTGWLVFLGVLFPVIGLSQSGPQAMAARFMYVPAIGLYIIMAWGVPDLLSRFPAKQTSLTIGGILAIFTVAMLGFLQTTHWANGITLLEHSMKITGDNSFGYEIMGGTALRAKDDVNASLYLKRALELNPRNEKALRALSSAMEIQGNIQEAISYCEKAVDIKPFYASAVISLGVLYFKAGFQEKGLKTIAKIEELPIDDNPDTRFNLGMVYMLSGDHEKARTYFQETLKMNPDKYEAHSYLGNMALKEGHTDNAIHEYLKAIEKNPALPEVHNQLGLLFVQKKLALPALKHFEQAHTLDPDFIDATYNLAYLLFQIHDYSRSKQLLQELIQKNPESQDALTLLKRIQTIQ